MQDLWLVLLYVQTIYDVLQAVAHAAQHWASGHSAVARAAARQPLYVATISGESYHLGVVYCHWVFITMQVL